MRMIYTVRTIDGAFQLAIRRTLAVFSNQIVVSAGESALFIVGARTGLIGRRVVINIEKIFI